MWRLHAHTARGASRLTDVDHVNSQLPTSNSPAFAQSVGARFGDKWLGFEDDELARLLTGAGLENVRVTTGASLAGDPFTVLVASGVRKTEK